ncbi:hypothetical protein, partial [Paraburkholderia eburnea]|uniref:hypothetical protein n=1 Tax=Paraburkholderia eburnea TaxID=1189126 RepID=UPI001ABFE719
MVASSLLKGAGRPESARYQVWRTMVEGVGEMCLRSRALLKLGCFLRSQSFDFFCWIWWGFWRFLVFVSVCERCPCAGRHLLFFAAAKKSRQKKAAHTASVTP